MDLNTPEQLAARSALARWLSGMLAGEIDPCSEPVPETALPPSIREAADRVRVLSGDAGFRGETERVRLFVNAPGGIPAPPYGSWWLEDTLQGETTHQVAEFYLEEGLISGEGTGPADYLPVELEFLHFLLQHQRAARMTRQADLEALVRVREREFLDRFVLPWISRFCSAGRNATGDPLWDATLDLLEEYLRLERACTQP